MSIDDNFKYEGSITLSFDDGYIDNYFNAYQLITKYKIPSIFFITTNNIDKEGYLTRNMIKEMDNKNFIDFGIHGHNHISFKNLNYAEIKFEINTSRNILGNLLGREIHNFSYPYGSLNENLKSQISNLNIRKCFDSTNKTFKINAYDNLQIPRISIWNIDNQSTFLNKISGKWDLINKFQKNNAN